MFSDLHGKKLPHLKISGAKIDCLSFKNLCYQFKTGNLLVLNYFFFKVSIVVVVLTVVSLTTTAVSATAGVTTVVVSVVVVVVSSFLSPLLQAAKDTDTIAKAKITFFIFCFV
jgi:hypothetical protein